MSHFDSKIFNGIKNFTGQEATNLVLGQGGFDILTGTTSPGNVFVAGEGDYTDVRMWIAIKVIDANETNVCAETLIGDDLSLNGVYHATAGNEVTMEAQETINGAFIRIRVNGSNDQVLAYRG